MTLQELNRLVSLDVRRDASFDTLGLIFYELPRMLVCLYDPKFIKECSRHPEIACVITTRDLADQLPDHLGVAVADDPRRTFREAHRQLLSQTEFYGATYDSQVAADALIHSDARVATSKVRIGPRCVVEAGAFVREGVTLEADVRIRAGVVLGADGFSPYDDGSGFENVPHSGRLHIHAGVEIQSNSVVCRGAYSGTTMIGAGSMISTLVNVSHNVHVGERCRIGSSACILGSARIGPGAWIGPNATVSNQVKVGAAARVTLGSVVVRDVPDGETVTGYFAVPHRQFIATLKEGRRRIGGTRS